MKTNAVVLVVLSFAIGFAVLSGSGLAGDVFGVAEQDQRDGDVIDELAEKNDPNPDDDDEGIVGGDVGGDNEPTLVRLVINSASSIATIVSSIVLLRSYLVELGMHPAVAVPVGLLAQTIAVVGVYQFVTNNNFR